uniref:Uncharacterized protein C18orf8 n=1 Tax=Schistocephalus solidus TaxID=70667 RepID=A0A0X3NTV2_SCHSO
MDNFAYLSQNPMVFEPISSLNSVFFDPANNQVFTLRARGALGVNVKTLGTTQSMNFRIQDHGDVLCIKFDPTCTILSLQRKNNSVDFINFDGGCADNTEYSQTCKNSSQLLGFVWTRDHELVCVTADGFELYQVNPTKRLASLLKQGAVQTNWYTWDPLNAILLLSSGSLATKFHVISFPRSSVVSKLGSFEIQFQDSAPVLPQKNCLLSNLYGKLYVCILTMNADGGVELALYQLMKNAPVRKTNVLIVPEQGQIAVNFVDNLILVHHKLSKTSLAYDIAVEGEFVDGVQRHFPILPPISLAEFKIPCKSIPSLSLEPAEEFKMTLYDSTWIVFPPNVVIDGSLGCLWTVELNLETFAKLISDPVTLVDCLTNRVGGKSVLLNYCRILVHQAVQELSTSVEENTSNNTLTFNREGFVRHLETFSRIFSRLAAVQSSAAKAKASVATGERISENCPEPIGQLYLRPFLFTLDDVNDSIFSVLSASEEPAIQRLLSHLVLDYMRVLKAHSLPVDAMLDELLVSSIVKAGDFCRLVHCVQSHTLKNSTHIRMGTANEAILEILLTKGDPATALRFCQSRPDLFTLPDTPRKLLDAAKQSSNPLVFYSIFRFFELAAQRQAPYACSLHDSKYQPYRNHFVYLFGRSSLHKSA